MKQAELTSSMSPGGDHGAACTTGPAVATKGISIACYPNEVPSFIEPELIRLYGSVFSSLEHFRVYGGTEHVSTYVAREGGKVVSVLLFRHKQRTVHVVNEIIKLDEQEVERFADYIFATFPAVGSISFNAVELELRRLPFPFQRFNCSEDIALALPTTPEAYLARLGKATRKNIKHHLNRLKRQFPSLRFSVYCTENISARVVHEIIELNRLRMAGKQTTSYLDEGESERLLRLVRSCGMVAVMTVDGRVCAGAICSRVGDNYFSYVTAHDPVYDAYRLGTLCCYLTICEAIVRGGREFHLLWGRYQYKYMLAGVQRNLDHLDIYRSSAQVFLHGGVVLRNAITSCLRQAKFWLLDPKRQDHSVLRPALVRLRQMRRMHLSGS